MILNVDYALKLNNYIMESFYMNPKEFVHNTAFSEPVLSKIMFEQWSWSSRTLRDDSLIARCLT